MGALTTVTMSLGKIIFGAGAFNTQYNQDKLDDVSKVLKYAFDNGITTIDTAAFYGPSEQLVGDALEEINADRSKIKICSKCCRWEDGRFTFSHEGVNSSVERSLKRLKTDYLDILYIHDVEFGAPNDVIEAISAAFALKSKGIVHNVGISGYPLETLLTTAKMVKAKLGKPLDAVLSYCNMTLQNNLLAEYKPRLEAAGVKLIVNASPLSMSLLRSGPTHRFHPGSKELLQTADQISNNLSSKGIELADVATQFSCSQWGGSTVIGLRTINEVDSAVRNYDISVSSPQLKLWTQIEEEFGKLHNVTWEEELPKKYKAQWNAVAKEL